MPNNQLTDLSLRCVSNGVIVDRYRYDDRFPENDGVHVFVDVNTFTEYMRSWFIALHGEKAVTQLPQARGFAPNGEG